MRQQHTATSTSVTMAWVTLMVLALGVAVIVMGIYTRGQTQSVAKRKAIQTLKDEVASLTEDNRLLSVQWGQLNQPAAIQVALQKMGSDLVPKRPESAQPIVLPSPADDSRSVPTSHRPTVPVKSSRSGQQASR